MACAFPGVYTALTFPPFPDSLVRLFHPITQRAHFCLAGFQAITHAQR